MMRRSMVWAGVAAAAMMMAATGAQAQAQVTPDGAETIRLALKDWLAANLNTGGGTVVTTLSGPIEVTPSGDRYTVVVPPMEMVIDPSDEDEDATGGTIQIGAITAELRPTAEGWYDATWTLPSEVVAEENDGDDVVTITLGGQRGTGVFAPAYQSFMSSDIELTDIVLSGTTGAGGSLASITMVSSSTEVGPETYDASGVFTLSGLSITDAEVEVFGLDRMVIEGSASAANLLELARFQAAIEDLQSRYEADAAGDMDDAFFAEVTALLDELPVLFNALDADYRLEGLRVDAPEGMVDLASTSFGFGVTGLGEGESTLTFRMGLSDLGIEPSPPFAEFIPSDALVDVAISGVPNADLMQTLRGFMQSSTTLGVEAAGEMAAGQLVQTLLTSNGAFEITAIRAVTPTITFDMTGAITPNPMSPFMVVGEASILIGGMDRAIAAAQGLPDGQQAIAGLTMVQTLGAQATDADGNPVRRYDVVIGENGDLLLNGVDLKPLLGGF